ncbi:MAG: hypothetical protein HZC28_12975 [Spirochaetes bacterium]|nr:hypothetical protein [Spirochaetota bacterium]
MSIMQHVMAEHRKLAIQRTMSVRRDAYLDYMTFRADGPLMFREIFGPLVGLKEEWMAQGATASELDLSAFRYREAFTRGVGAATGYVGEDRSEMIEENDNHIVFRDARGTKQKLIKGSSTLPLPMEHPVKNMDDWLRVKKHYEFNPGRMPGNIQERAAKNIADGCVITADIPGGFDEVRILLGDEEAAVAGYTQPELVHEILSTIADTACRVFDAVTKDTVIDMLCVHEDMAGKSGPMWGPKQVDEFIKPYYRRIWDMLRDRGARLFFIDSDGDCNPILDNLIDAGINLFSPCEPEAGMDVASIRQKYGTRLALEGGINKYVLREGKAAIDRELEAKIPPLMKTGGAIIALDHRIPNGTPLENYRYYVRRAGEIIGIG